MIGTYSAAPAAAFSTVGPEPGGAVAREDEPGDAGGLGRAQDRAEVARIGDPVDDHEERVGRGDQVVDRRGVDRRGERDHALRRLRAGALLELDRADERGRARRRPPRGARDLVAPPAPLDDPHLAHRAPARPEQLAHGVEPLDLIATEVGVARRPLAARGHVSGARWCRRRCPRS